jgi:hypothetical protein
MFAQCPITQARGSGLQDIPARNPVRGAGKIPLLIFVMQENIIIGGN